MAQAMGKARPLSPHLQIWRWTPTMAASILHRATGAALYAGTFLLAAFAIIVAMGEAAYAELRAVLASPLGYALLAGYVWALSFHLLAGLRYLYFDSGRGLAPKTAARSALFVFALSFLIAAGALFAALGARA